MIPTVSSENLMHRKVLHNTVMGGQILDCLYMQGGDFRPVIVKTFPPNRMMELEAEVRVNACANDTGITMPLVARVGPNGLAFEKAHEGDLLDACALTTDFVLRTRWAVGLVQAVRKLHAHRIVHRDVSPENAVLRKGQVRLIDLGLSNMMEEGKCMVGGMAGKVNYLCPAGLQGRPHNGYLGDLYSAAISALTLMMSGSPYQIRGPGQWEEMQTFLADPYRFLDRWFGTFGAFNMEEGDAEFAQPFIDILVQLLCMEDVEQLDSFLADFNEVCHNRQKARYAHFKSMIH
jgi:serine/threonine protein kinase